MPYLRAERVVTVRWPEVKREFDEWVTIIQGSSYVLTYPALHLEYVARELGIGEVRLIGLRVHLPHHSRAKQVADIIFLGGRNDYYVVACSDADEGSRAKEEVVKEAIDFGRVLYNFVPLDKRDGISITPVAAMMSDYPEGVPPRGYRKGVPSYGL